MLLATLDLGYDIGLPFEFDGLTPRGLRTKPPEIAS
jgi:hypothetical protein